MKVLILKPSSLGDVVQALPLLRLLKLHRPDAEIHWWLAAELLPLLDGDPDLAAVIPFERRRWRSPGYWPDGIAQIRAMRDTHYDWAIDLQGLARSATFAWLARGEFTVGLELEREGAHLAYDVAVPRPKDQPHAVDWYLAVARTLGIPVHDRFEWLPPRASIAHAVETKWPRDGFRWLGINPGARWDNKRWPVEHFAELVRQLAAREPAFRFALLGGPGDWALTNAIQNAAPDRCVNFAGRTTLPELIELLRRCELLVTNDTGPMHLAAALRRPVISLFGPTRPDQTGPYGQTHLALSHPLPCAPCMKSRCHWAEPLACLRHITPTRVAETVLARLAR
ncbi:MAG: lipopolysaccharide heptosyltransferase II [Proteobacteria bacterium]|nr:lipopolysaccharide heptosyltransferase II [Pseudomonadota bacterium]